MGAGSLVLGSIAIVWGLTVIARKPWLSVVLIVVGAGWLVNAMALLV